MKIDMHDYTVVTSHFANTKKLESAGFKVMSLVAQQPKGMSLPVFRGSTPSEFCQRLYRFEKYKQAWTEYKRQKGNIDTISIIQNELASSGSSKIAIVGWYKDDSKCFRKCLRDVFNKHFRLTDVVKEYEEELIEC